MNKFALIAGSAAYQLVNVHDFFGGSVTNALYACTFRTGENLDEYWRKCEMELSCLFPKEFKKREP